METSFGNQQMVIFLLWKSNRGGKICSIQLDNVYHLSTTIWKELWTVYKMLFN